MNYYVLSRVLWNSKVDVDAIVEEHYKLMFGPGAPEMKEFFDALEKKWLKNVVGNIVETSLGPTIVRPPEYKLWQEIYSPAFMANARKLFDTAAKKAAKTPEASNKRSKNRNGLILKRRFTSTFLLIENGEGN